jgi:hypothetical protein
VQYCASYYRTVQCICWGRSSAASTHPQTSRMQRLPISVPRLTCLVDAAPAPADTAPPATATAWHKQSRPSACCSSSTLNGCGDENLRTHKRMNQSKCLTHVQTLANQVCIVKPSRLLTHAVSIPTCTSQLCRTTKKLCPSHQLIRRAQATHQTPCLGGNTNGHPQNP